MGGEFDRGTVSLNCGWSQASILEATPTKGNVVGHSGKLAGKTEWAGRRRPPTRRAGFNATAPVQLTREGLEGYRLRSGQQLVYRFAMPANASEQWVGFGGWFAVDAGIAATLEWDDKHVLTSYVSQNWNKVGSLLSGSRGATEAVLTFKARSAGVVTTHSMLAGGVLNDHLTTARPNLRPNMWSCAPEANFYDPRRAGAVTVTDDGLERVPGRELVLKSCNRCGRFLPVNIGDERAALSFSNHCVAEHVRPCRHAGFGKIVDRDSDEIVLLEYGFQLECRFCKKFEVNAAHNPQRTPGQMKEDGARRRHFELLLERLYGGSPQLRYKNQTGRDLASDVFERFDRRCFKCGSVFVSARDMQLDHTRPLALLWPLDGTATSLCVTHNSEKRDRAPGDYYTEDELVRLAAITGIGLNDLQDPRPNMDAIALLGKKLNWFHHEFLTLPALQHVREGKLAADLVVKGLRKVLARCPGGPPFEI